MNTLRKGDTIKCSNADEAINLMYNLYLEDIQTDFLYEKDGKRGLWIQITKVKKFDYKEILAGILLGISFTLVFLALFGYFTL